MIVFVLFAFSLGDDVHPQESRQCAMDKDVHELLVKMKCELVNMKEELRAFKGKCDYSYIFKKRTSTLKFLCVTH